VTVWKLSILLDGLAATRTSSLSESSMRAKYASLFENVLNYNYAIHEYGNNCNSQVFCCRRHLLA